MDVTKSTLNLDLNEEIEAEVSSTCNDTVKEEELVTVSDIVTSDCQPFAVSDSAHQSSLIHEDMSHSLSPDTSGALMQYVSDGDNVVCLPFEAQQSDIHPAQVQGDVMEQENVSIISSELETLSELSGTLSNIGENRSLTENVLISTTMEEGDYAVLNWDGEEVVEISSDTLTLDLDQQIEQSIDVSSATHNNALGRVEVDEASTSREYLLSVSNPDSTTREISEANNNIVPSFIEDEVSTTGGDLCFVSTSRAVSNSSTPISASDECLVVPSAAKIDASILPTNNTAGPQTLLTSSENFPQSSGITTTSLKVEKVSSRKRRWDQPPAALPNTDGKSSSNNENNQLTSQEHNKSKSNVMQSDKIETNTHSATTMNVIIDPKLDSVSSSKDPSGISKLFLDSNPFTSSHQECNIDTTTQLQSFTKVLPSTQSTTCSLSSENSSSSMYDSAVKLSFAEQNRQQIEHVVKEKLISTSNKDMCVEPSSKHTAASSTFIKEVICSVNEEKPVKQIGHCTEKEASTSTNIEGYRRSTTSKGKEITQKCEILFTPRKQDSKTNFSLNLDVVSSNSNPGSNIKNTFRAIESEQEIISKQSFGLFEEDSGSCCFSPTITNTVNEKEVIPSSKSIMEFQTASDSNILKEEQAVPCSKLVEQQQGEPNLDRVKAQQAVSCSETIKKDKEISISEPVINQQLLSSNSKKLQQTVQSLDLLLKPQQPSVHKQQQMPDKEIIKTQNIVSSSSPVKELQTSPIMHSTKMQEVQTTQDSIKEQKPLQCLDLVKIQKALQSSTSVKEQLVTPSLVLVKEQTSVNTFALVEGLKTAPSLSLSKNVVSKEKTVPNLNLIKKHNFVTRVDNVKEQQTVSGSDVMEQKVLPGSEVLRKQPTTSSSNMSEKQLTVTNSEMSMEQENVPSSAMAKEQPVVPSLDVAKQQDNLSLNLVKKQQVEPSLALVKKQQVESKPDLVKKKQVVPSPELVKKEVVPSLDLAKKRQVVLSPDPAKKQQQVMPSSDPVKKQPQVMPFSDPAKKQQIVPSPDPAKKQQVVPSPYPAKKQQVVATSDPAKKQQVMPSPDPAKKQQVVPSPDPAKKQQVVPSPDPVKKQQVVPSPDPAKKQQVVPSPDPAKKQPVVLSPDPAKKQQVVLSPDPAKKQQVVPSPDPAKKQQVVPSSDPSKKQQVLPSPDTAKKQQVVPSPDPAKKQHFVQSPDVAKKQQAVPSPDVVKKQQAVPSPDVAKKQQAVPSPDVAKKQQAVPSPDVAKKQQAVPRPDVAKKQQAVPSPDVAKKQAVPSPDVAKQQAVPSPDVAKKQQAVPSPDVAKKQQAVPSPDVVKKQQAVPSPDVAKKQQAVPSPDVAKKQQAVPSPDVAKKQQTVSSPDVAKKQQAVPSPDVAKKQQRVPSPDVAKKQQAAPSPDVAKKQQAVPSPDVAKKQQAVPSPDVAKKQQAVPSPDVAKKQQAVQSPDVAKKQQAVPSPDVAKKQQAVPRPDVAKKQQAVPSPDVAKKQQAVPSPDVAKKQQAVPSPDVAKKQQAVPSPDVAKKQQRVQSPDVAKKQQAVPTPDVAKKQQRVPSPDVAKKQQRVPSPDVAKKQQRVPSPDVAKKQQRVPSPDVPKKQQRVPSPDVTKKQQRVPSPDVTKMQQAVPSPGVAKKLQAVPSPCVAKKHQAGPNADEVKKQQAVPSPDVAKEQQGVQSPGVTKKQQALLSPDMANKQHDVPSPVDAIKQQSVPSPDVALKQQAVPSPDVALKQQAVSSPDVALKQQAVQSPDRVKKQQVVQSPNLSNKEQVVPNSDLVKKPVPSTDVANKQEAVPSSAVAKKQEAVPSSAVAKKQEAVPSSAVAKKQEAVPSSAVAKKQQAVPSPDVAKEQQAVASPDVAKKQQAVPSQDVIMKQQAVPSPDVEKLQQDMLSPCVVQHQQGVLTPDLVKKQQVVPSPDLVKQQGVPSPNVAKKQQIVCSADVVKKQQFVCSADVAMKQQAVPSPDVAKKQQALPSSGVTNKEQLVLSPGVTKEQQAVPNPDIAKKLQGVPSHNLSKQQSVLSFDVRKQQSVPYPEVSQQQAVPSLVLVKEQQQTVQSPDVVKIQQHFVSNPDVVKKQHHVVLSLDELKKQQQGVQCPDVAKKQQQVVLCSDVGKKQQQAQTSLDRVKKQQQTVPSQDVIKKQQLQQPVPIQDVMKKQQQAMPSLDVVKKQQQHTVPSPDVVKKQQHTVPSPDVVKKQEHAVPSPDVVKQQYSVPSPDVVKKQQYAVPSRDVVKKQQEAVPIPVVMKQQEAVQILDDVNKQQQQTVPCPDAVKKQQPMPCSDVVKKQQQAVPSSGAVKKQLAMSSSNVMEKQQAIPCSNIVNKQQAIPSPDMTKKQQAMPSSHVKTQQVAPSSSVLKLQQTVSSSDLEKWPTSQITDVKKHTTLSSSDMKKLPVSPISDVKEQPASLISDVKKQPASQSSDVKTQPAFPSSVVKMQPASPGSDVKKQSASLSLDVKKQLALPNSDVKKQAASLSSDVKNQPASPSSGVKKQPASPSSDVKKQSASPSTGVMKQQPVPSSGTVKKHQCVPSSNAKKQQSLPTSDVKNQSTMPDASMKKHQVVSDADLKMQPNMPNAEVIMEQAVPCSDVKTEQALPSSNVKKQLVGPNSDVKKQPFVPISYVKKQQAVPGLDLVKKQQIVPSLDVMKKQHAVSSLDGMIEQKTQSSADIKEQKTVPSVYLENVMNSVPILAHKKRQIDLVTSDINVLITEPGSSPITDQHSADSDKDQEVMFCPFSIKQQADPITKPEIMLSSDPVKEQKTFSGLIQEPKVEPHSNKQQETVFCLDSGMKQKLDGKSDGNLSYKTTLKSTDAPCFAKEVFKKPSIPVEKSISGHTSTSVSYMYPTKGRVKLVRPQLSTNKDFKKSNFDSPHILEELNKSDVPLMDVVPDSPMFIKITPGAKGLVQKSEEDLRKTETIKLLQTVTSDITVKCLQSTGDASTSSSRNPDRNIDGLQSNVKEICKPGSEASILTDKDTVLEQLSAEDIIETKMSFELSKETAILKTMSESVALANKSVTVLPGSTETTVKVTEFSDIHNQNSGIVKKEKPIVGRALLSENYRDKTDCPISSSKGTMLTKANIQSVSSKVIDCPDLSTIVNPPLIEYESSVLLETDIPVPEKFLHSEVAKETNLRALVSDKGAISLSPPTLETNVINELKSDTKLTPIIRKDIFLSPEVATVTDKKENMMNPSLVQTKFIKDSKLKSDPIVFPQKRIIISKSIPETKEPDSPSQSKIPGEYKETIDSLLTEAKKEVTSMDDLKTQVGVMTNVSKASDNEVQQITVSVKESGKMQMAIKEIFQLKTESNIDTNSECSKNLTPLQKLDSTQTTLETDKILMVDGSTSTVSNTAEALPHQFENPIQTVDSKKSLSPETVVKAVTLHTTQQICVKSASNLSTDLKANIETVEEHVLGPKKVVKSDVLEDTKLQDTIIIPAKDIQKSEAESTTVFPKSQTVTRPAESTRSTIDKPEKIILKITKEKIATKELHTFKTKETRKIFQEGLRVQPSDILATKTVGAVRSQVTSSQVLKTESITERKSRIELLQVDPDLIEPISVKIDEKPVPMQSKHSPLTLKLVKDSTKSSSTELKSGTADYINLLPTLKLEKSSESHANVQKEELKSEKITLKFKKDFTKFGVAAYKEGKKERKKDLSKNETVVSTTGISEPITELLSTSVKLSEVPQPSALDSPLLNEPKVGKITFKLKKDTTNPSGIVATISKGTASEVTVSSTKLVNLKKTDTNITLEEEPKVEKLTLKIKKDTSHGEVSTQPMSAIVKHSEGTVKSEEIPKLEKLTLKLKKDGSNSETVLASPSKDRIGLITQVTEGKQSELEEGPKVEKLKLKLKKEPGSSETVPCKEKFTPEIIEAKQLNPEGSPKREKITLRLRKDSGSSEAIIAMHKDVIDSSKEMQEGLTPEKITLTIKKDSSTTEKKKEKRLDICTSSKVSEIIGSSISKDVEKITLKRKKDCLRSDTPVPVTCTVTSTVGVDKLETTFKKENKCEKSMSKRHKDLIRSENVGKDSVTYSTHLIGEKTINKPDTTAKEEQKVEKLTLKLKKEPCISGKDVTDVSSTSGKDMHAIKPDTGSKEDNKVEKITLKLKKDISKIKMDVSKTEMACTVLCSTDKKVTDVIIDSSSKSDGKSEKNILKIKKEVTKSVNSAIVEGSTASTSEISFSPKQIEDSTVAKDDVKRDKLTLKLKRDGSKDTDETHVLTNREKHSPELSTGLLKDDTKLEKITLKRALLSKDISDIDNNAPFESVDSSVDEGKPEKITLTFKKMAAWSVTKSGHRLQESSVVETRENVTKEVSKSESNVEVICKRPKIVEPIHLSENIVLESAHQNRDKKQGEYQGHKRQEGAKRKEISDIRSEEEIPNKKLKADNPTAEIYTNEMETVSLTQDASVSTSQILTAEKQETSEDKVELSLEGKIREILGTKASSLLEGDVSISLTSRSVMDKPTSIKDTTPCTARLEDVESRIVKDVTSTVGTGASSQVNVSVLATHVTGTISRPVSIISECIGGLLDSSTTNIEISMPKSNIGEDPGEPVKKKSRGRPRKADQAPKPVVPVLEVSRPKRMCRGRERPPVEEKVKKPKGRGRGRGCKRKADEVQIQPEHRPGAVPLSTCPWTTSGKDLLSTGASIISPISMVNPLTPSRVFLSNKPPPLVPSTKQPTFSLSIMGSNPTPQFNSPVLSTSSSQTSVLSKCLTQQTSTVLSNSSNQSTTTMLSNSSTTAQSNSSTHLASAVLSGTLDHLTSAVLSNSSTSTSLSYSSNIVAKSSTLLNASILTTPAKTVSSIITTLSNSDAKSVPVTHTVLSKLSASTASLSKSSTLSALAAQMNPTTLSLEKAVRAPTTPVITVTPSTPITLTPAFLSTPSSSVSSFLSAPTALSTPSTMSAPSLLSSSPILSAPTAESLCPPLGVSIVQVFEEETRMSAESSSRSQTPARALPLAGGAEGVGEESQGSAISTATTESGKKKGRMEVGDGETREFTVEQVAEYQWPVDKGGEHLMVQEQISEYLGVKSFKRKYPDLRRRPVEAEEKTYLREKGLVSEAMCDMGLTAVISSEVLDVMYADFQEKYEEYRRFVRERQNKELTVKQKAAAGTTAVDKNKQDCKEKAISSAAAWNAKFNKARKDERRCCFDLQTFTIHFPRSKGLKMIPKDIPKVGHFPVSLIPGQFQDYYKSYTPAELRYFPLNTVLYGPMKPNERQEPGGGSDGSQSESEDSTSSDDSSSTTSSEATQDTEETASTAGEGDADASQEQSHGERDKDKERDREIERAGKEREAAICKVCSGDKSKNKEGRPEVLIHCAQCTSSGHPSCLDLTLDMVPHIRRYDWQCTDCKTCIQCKDPADEDKMLFCDMCDRGYHIYCVGLRRVPSGRWHCKECAVCGSCGTQEPGGSMDATNSNAQWQHEYKKGEKGARVYAQTLCVPCSKLWRKGRYCQLCWRCYGNKPDEEAGLINCSVCDKWMHAECCNAIGGIEVDRSSNFLCELCQEKGQARSPAIKIGVMRPVVKV